MPRPSKFTAPVRESILADARLGLPRYICAARAGIGEGTLRGWVDRGKALPEESESGYRRFYDELIAAESELPTKALRVIHSNLDTRPDIALKVAERMLPNLAPPQPKAPPVQTGPLVIALNLSDGAPAVGAQSVIEVGLAQDEATGEVRALPAPSS